MKYVAVIGAMDVELEGLQGKPQESAANRPEPLDFPLYTGTIGEVPVLLDPVRHWQLMPGCTQYLIDNYPSGPL